MDTYKNMQPFVELGNPPVPVEQVTSVQILIGDGEAVASAWYELELQRESDSLPIVPVGKTELRTRGV